MALVSTSRSFRISQKNERFLKKIKELSGETVELCYQCGGCSSACPLTSEMDLLPSKVMRLVQLGDEEVLKAHTFWICSTCFNCTARCPRGIDIANVMEALRQTVLRTRYDEVKLDALKKEELAGIPPIALVSSLRKLTA